MTYPATSSPIAIQRRPAQSTTASPTWSPQSSLSLSAGYSRPASSSSSSSSSSTSSISTTSSSSSNCAFPSWHMYGNSAGRRRSSSFISDDELAVEDASASGSDDEFVSRDYQMKRALSSRQQHYRRQSQCNTPDSDDMDVLQRVLAAGFTLADPSTESETVSDSPKGSSKSKSKGSRSRSQSRRKTARGSNTMTTIMEVGE